MDETLLVENAPFLGAVLEVPVGTQLTLEQMRVSKLLSAYELAKRSGIAHKTIMAIERGEAKPRLSTIRKLAEALGIDPRAIAWPGDPLGQPDSEVDD